MRDIRVRFAPSPTGPLHIGGVRTALYNYLFAKQNNGKLILRIEDTDSQRYTEGSENHIKESLDFIGVQFDEGYGIGGEYGPYVQSERKHIYREYVDILLLEGKAYYAFDSAEELNREREASVEFKYDYNTRSRLRNSLTMTKDKVDELISSGAQYVVRFKVEPNETITVDDMIRGQVSFNTSVLDDKVLYKSADDLPTYHLANIVDDHLMAISHVIRGEEWLPSAPFHVLLYKAFNWTETMPRFAHLPLLLKPEGNGKLSKRDGEKLGFPVFVKSWGESVGYAERGYIGDALFNFLALQGWNPGDDQEVLTKQSLIDKFDLSRCSKGGVKFNYKKAEWLNGIYLKTMDSISLVKTVSKMSGYNVNDRLVKAIRYSKYKHSTLSSLVDSIHPLMNNVFNYNIENVKKKWKPESAIQMIEIATRIEQIDDFVMENIESTINDWIEESGYKAGVVMPCMRILLMGSLTGPHIHEIIKTIGKEEAVKRLKVNLDESKN